MTVLARLSFWVPPERMTEFNSYYEKQAIPVLQKHGLTASAISARPTVVGVFNQLFELGSPAKVSRYKQVLQQDSAWQQVLQCLGGGADTQLVWNFEPYCSPAVPSTIVPAGSGFRQGLWRTLGVQDGLPAAVVWHLIQGQDGSMWFATQDRGLCRYDGEYFYCFNAAGGLTSDGVRALLQDRHGHLWIGTDRGVCRYDGEYFNCYTAVDGLTFNTVSCIQEDREGYLWFATLGEGVYRYDGKGFDRYTSIEGLANDSVWTILEDRKGHLWFGTRGGGVSRYDGSNFQTFTTEDGLGGNEVYSLLEDRCGHLWFGTWGRGGLSRFDGQRFSSCLEEDILGDREAHVLINDQLEDREGNLWLGINAGGVCRWDGEHLVRFTSEDGLANNQVNALCQDHNGDLWCATRAGISVYASGQFANYTNNNGLKSWAVFALCQDRDGHIWAGTATGGLSRFDGSRISSFTKQDGLAGDNVRCLLEDQHGQIWVQGWAGISCWDGKEFRAFPIPADLEIKAGGWSLLEDQHGHLWFGTIEGVVRWDGQAFRRFTTADGLLCDDVSAMLEDREGRLWFGTAPLFDLELAAGVCHWDGSGFRVLAGLCGKQVKTIFEARNGCLWFGTWSHGAICWDGQTFTYLTTKDGLCYDNVLSIVEDRRGRLWFGTFGGGVSIYDGLVFQTLGRRDGLAHDTVQEIIEDRHGNLWIATEGGLTRYTPFEEPPQVRITQVRTDQPNDPVAGPIEVASWQKSVRFEFQGRSFTTSSERLVYVCRLQGYEAEWKPIYNTTGIEYQDLAQGEYTFQVKAVDRDLNYSAPAQVQITVTPDTRLAALTEALSATGPVSDFVGQSAALRRVQTQLAEVAPTDLTVLVLGETGTGKGLAARALHGLSQRHRGPFIPVNCGALPKDLVESELFGHEKGAFTGAHARKLGKVELAGKGTLFLDEIGDMPLEAQVKLLGVLEERTFQRVGGTQILAADVRVVAATNRDLEQMVAEGRFRQDLYFRLQVFPLPLPPLRQRGEDIPLLASYFTERIAAHLAKEVRQLSPAALTKLQAYPWPGNVRELEHVVQRAVIVCRGPTIGSGDLLLGSGPVGEEEPQKTVTLEENERNYIRQVLEQCNWQIKGPAGAAVRLGLAPSTLRGRIVRLGLERS